ncbi:MAG: HAD family hydrolase [Bacteroidales bacterium]|nr:HAD family hydrolase [Bacteroidales bacterium]
MTPIRIEDLNLQNIRCVVFDLDGTLYDKRRLPLRLVFGDFPYVLHLAAERIVRKQLRGKRFKSAKQFYKELFRRLANVRLIRAEKAKQWFYKRYMPLTLRLLRKHYEVAPFVPELLKQLKERGIRTAVLSDYGFAEEKLQAIGLDPESFDYVFSAPELGGLKPNKEAFEKMLAILQVEPHEALMIGDRTECDGEGAAAVGMPFYKV